MAKIQNPQNEKGETLATNIKVEALIKDRLEPLEKKVKESFEAITSADQFIQLEQEISDSEGSEYYKTNISANVTKSIDDVDGVTDETNKLVTSKVLNTAILDVKSSISNLEDEIKEEINLRTEGDADLRVLFDENFENLSEEVNEHVFNASVHVSEEDRERWDKAEGLLDEHINDSTIHVTSEDKIKWGGAASDISAHLAKTGIHVAAEDKEKWDNKLDTQSGTTLINDINDKTTISSESSSNDIKIELSGSILNPEISLNADIAQHINLEEEPSKSIPSSSAVKDLATNLRNKLDISAYYFPELEYEERKDYILYDNSLNPVYISFANKITDGSNMFKDTQSMTLFNITLPNLVNGDNMFNGCVSLISFNCPLNKLESGIGMFTGCKLSPESVLYILENLNTNLQSVGTIDLGVLTANKSAIISLLIDNAYIEDGTTELTSLTVGSNKWNVNFIWH